MSRCRHNDERCEFCGLQYRALRTGLTYREVRMMLWVGSTKQSDWKYKRRHTVLGLWHQLKRGQWKDHLEMCEAMADAVGL